MFAEDNSEDFSDLTFTGFYSISGYLRNLRGRLLSSEKFSEVFALWVFTLKPFPGQVPKEYGSRFPRAKNWQFLQKLAVFVIRWL